MNRPTLLVPEWFNIADYVNIEYRGQGSSMPTNEPDLDRVKELYVNWTVAERRADDSHPVLPFAHLVAFFLDGTPLSRAQQAALFRSPHLRDQFQRIKSDLAWRLGTTEGAHHDGAIGTRIVGLPAARAAADDAQLSRREFDEGTLSLIQSAVPHHVYVLIRLRDPGHPPSRLVLEGSPPGEVAITTLPRPDPDGTIRLLKNLNVESEALFLRLLRSPTTEGTFVA